MEQVEIKEEDRGVSPIAATAAAYAAAFRTQYNPPKPTTPTSPSRASEAIPKTTGISRIISLSECFAPNPSGSMATVEHWQDVVDKQFAPNCNFNLILYSKQTNNRRSFDLKNYSLANFFAAMYSGPAPLAECLFTVENPREMATHQGLVIEASRSSWTLYFMSGAQVVMRGGMTVICEPNPSMRIQSFEFNCLGWREYMPREMWLTFFAKAGNNPSNSVSLQQMPPTQFGEYGLPAYAIRSLETGSMPFKMSSLPGTPEGGQQKMSAPRVVELQQYGEQLQLQLNLLMQLAAANRDTLTVDDQRQILLRIAMVTQQIQQVQTQQAQLEGGQLTPPTTQPVPSLGHAPQALPQTLPQTVSQTLSQNLSHTLTQQNRQGPSPSAHMNGHESPTSAPSPTNVLKPPTTTQRTSSLSSEGRAKKNPVPTGAKRAKKTKRTSDSDPSYSDRASDGDFHPTPSHGTSKRKPPSRRRASKPSIDVSSPVIGSDQSGHSQPSMMSALASQMQGNAWLNSPAIENRPSPTMAFPQVNQTFPQQFVPAQYSVQGHTLTPHQIAQLHAARQLQFAQLLEEKKREQEMMATDQSYQDNELVMRNQHLLQQMQQAAANLGPHKNHIVIEPPEEHAAAGRTMSLASNKTDDVDFAAYLEEKPQDNAAGTPW